MILVDVYVPALNRTFDFKLDENAEIRSVKEDMVKILCDEIGEDGEGRGAGFALCSYEQGRVLKDGSTLRECGVGNGSRLLIL